MTSKNIYKHSFSIDEYCCPAAKLSLLEYSSYSWHSHLSCTIMASTGKASNIIKCNFSHYTINKSGSPKLYNTRLPDWRCWDFLVLYQALFCSWSGQRNYDAMWPIASHQLPTHVPVTIHVELSVQSRNFICKIVRQGMLIRKTWSEQDHENHFI